MVVGKKYEDAFNALNQNLYSIKQEPQACLLLGPYIFEIVSLIFGQYLLISNISCGTRR